MKSDRNEALYLNSYFGIIWLKRSVGRFDSEKFTGDAFFFLLAEIPKLRKKVIGA